MMKLLIHSQTLNSEAVKMAEMWLALWFIYDFVSCGLKHLITNVVHEIKVVLKKYET